MRFISFYLFCFNFFLFSVELFYVSVISNSIAVSHILFDFDQNENYSTVDLCFHLRTVTSIDHWVLKFYCSVN